MNASLMRNLIVFASAAAALPGLPHPLSAAELPHIIARQVSPQATTPGNTDRPFGDPLRRVSRIRLPEEQKRRDLCARLEQGDRPVA